MPIPTVDPTVSIKDLIVANWIPGNVVGTTTPDFHTGWHNPKSIAPQVTFANKAENPKGASGYAAIKGDGTGPVQIVDGVLFADCWASRDEGGGGSNPKTLVYDMGREINRIVLANFETIANLTYLSILGIVDVIPDRKTKGPLTFHTSITIGFNWRTT